MWTAAGFVLLLCLAQVSPLPTSERQAEKKILSFDDVIPSKFPVRGFNGTWISGEFTHNFKNI